MRLKFKGTFWLGLSLLLLTPNFLPVHLIHLNSEGYKWESFDPDFQIKIRSVDDIIRYVDSIAIEKKIPAGSLTYASLFSKAIRKRFYHSFSHYTLKDNWIAALAGKYVWYDLSAIVFPDDILKYPMAGCSQQSIVIAECFKRKGIPYRRIEFKHHFAIEGKINGQWYFFDTDMEPNFTSVPRESFDLLKKEKVLPEIYSKSMDSATTESLLDHPSYGKVNENIAAHAKNFHKLTWVLSRIIWLLPLFIWGVWGRKKQKRVKSNTVRPINFPSYSKI